MSAAGDPLRQQVVSDTPSAVGTVAGEEADSHPGQQMFVVPLLCDDALEVGAWDELEYLTEHAA